MSGKDDDKVYKDLFGEDEVPAPKAPEPEPVAEEEIEEAAGSVEDAMSRDAAEVFASMLAGDRPAEEAPARPQKQQEEVREVSNRFTFVQADGADDKETRSFSESVEPWTLFRGIAVVAMAVYVFGFFGTKLSDAWLTILVITVAVTTVVLVVDFVRLPKGAQDDSNGQAQR